MKKLLRQSIALCLSLSLLALPTLAISPQQTLELLETHYLYEIPDGARQAPTVDEMLAALGDPYARYYPKVSSIPLTPQAPQYGVGIVSSGTAGPAGLEILAVIPYGPADNAGLQAGDLIETIDGVRLTDGMQTTSLLLGTEDTVVALTLTVGATGGLRRAGLVREALTPPTVVPYPRGDRMVLACSRFELSTFQEWALALERYAELDTLWVGDLRGNGGGLTDSAAAAVAAHMEGGNQTIFYLRDSDDSYERTPTAPGHTATTQRSLVLLVDGDSASASELFTAAIRDHGVGIAVGDRTYGKGIAQTVFTRSSEPDLFQGDAMQFTTHDYFSPDGFSCHQVGLVPTLTISAEQAEAVALLLACAPPDKASGHLKLELAGQTLYLSLAEIAQAPAPFQELLEALPPSAQLYEGVGGDQWAVLSPKQAALDQDVTLQLRTFSDTDGTPADPAIDTLAVHGLLSGYGDGTFLPTAPILRAEFCAMLATALRLTESDATLPFSDVTDQWYAQPVAALHQAGLLSGYEDGTFRPDAPITGQEMVSVLAQMSRRLSIQSHQRFLAQDFPAAALAEYGDYAAWARPAALALEELEGLDVIQAPTDSATRATAAQLLCSFMQATHILWPDETKG